MKKIFLISISLFLALNSFAQSLDQQAADFLRESDKLYVVISILVTIFAVLIVFLIFQERKISKLEKQIKDKKS